MAHNDITKSENAKFHALIVKFVRSTVLFWVPAVIFIVLASLVDDNEPLPGDVAILTFFYSLTSDALNSFFLAVTALGGGPIVVPVLAITAGVLWYLGHKRQTLFLLFSVGGTGIINFILKLVFARDRPDLWQTLVLEGGFSFPSGHAMTSSSIALAAVVLTWHTKYRWYVVVTSLVYALLVGVSRLYLGVHFPSDIIAGWCISILWILTLHHAFKAVYGRRASISD